MAGIASKAPMQESQESTTAKRELVDDMALLNLRSPVNEGLCTKSKPITVVLGVGPDCETFYLHQHLATQHSEFFTAALGKRWKGSESSPIRVPEDNPAYFDLFARFLYDQKIHSIKNDDRATKGQDQEWLRLGEAWVLGGKLLSTTFKDAVMDTIQVKLSKGSPYHYPTALHSISYAKTSGDNSFKRFCVDVATTAWSKSDFQELNLAEAPKEFLRDLAVQSRFGSKEGQAPNSDEAGTCKYHEHCALQTSCYKTMYQ